MKRALLFLFLLTTLLPQASHAQLDARCWTKDECSKARQTQTALNTMSKTEIDSGFVQSTETKKICKGDKDAAGTDIGFCLPSGQTETKIAFGGKKKFLHIGDAIQTLYQYGIAITGILAVIMIIIAGLTWTTSGGNPERITSAKKRIAGAITGLTLAVLSYTILNTLNPALVNIRLPQVWMINTQGLAPPVCSDVQGGKKLSLLGSSSLTTEQRAPLLASVGAQTSYTTEPADAICGNDYFVQGAGALSCRGDSCGGLEQICFKGPASPNPTCKEGRILGNISNSSLQESFIRQTDGWVERLGADMIIDFWAWPWIDEIHLATICKDTGETSRKISGSVKNFESVGEDKIYAQEFSFTYTNEDIDKWSTTCGPTENFRGYLLMVEMDIPNEGEEEGHYISTKENKTTDLCDLPDNPLSCPNLLFNDGYCADNCEQIFKKTTSPGIPDSWFFSSEELKNGILLDIDVGAIPYINRENGRRTQHYSKYGWRP